MVSDEDRSMILSKYMNTLRISGYDQVYRFQILKGVLIRQEQMSQEITLGNRVRYRSQKEIEKQKREKICDPELQTNRVFDWSTWVSIPC